MSDSIEKLRNSKKVRHQEYHDSCVFFFLYNSPHFLIVFWTMKEEFVVTDKQFNSLPNNRRREKKKMFQNT